MEFAKLNDFKIPQWFCIQTKPGSEPLATLSLTRLPSETRENVGDIEVYYPKIKTTMPVAGVNRSVVKSLFPRYFFAKFVWMEAARFVESRPQILGIVKFGGVPSIVPVEVIGELCNWSFNKESQLFDPSTNFEPGQRVLIKTGPFKGMEADFVSHLSDQKRVSLLLDYLHTHVQVIIDRTYLKPAF